MAYEHNPKINQLLHQIEAQRQQETLGLGIRNPEISYFREGIGEGTFSEQRWSVSQQLDFPLTSYYRYKSEQATTHSLELQLEALKLQVKRQVKSAYTTLAYAIRQENLAQERVELFESLHKAARARADLGESSGIDAMQANLQLREAQNSLELADNQIMEARYDLFQTIGLDPEAQTYDISFPDTLRYVEIDVTQQEILQRLESHPQLKQIDREQRAAAYLTKAAKSTYFPDLSVSYYRQDFGGNYDFYGFEVGVSIPLWFGANTSKRVKQAKAQYRTVGWAFEDNYLLIKKQAEQAWHGYETSRTNIIRFRENIRDESIELVNMTQRGYRMGELDLLTLLEAQRTYLRTQEAYYQTLRNYYLRIIELEQYLQTDIIFNE
ncbi:TolC family protein [Halalkalibaculum sp. DA3122]|uniref:TolC family protein n=1 Tax=Halalkalibaculum sp. DA3122 TaxID=3373607 RepID=UPI0037542B8A